MPKKIDFSLTKEQLQEVKHAMKKHDDLRVRNRAQMLHMLHMGQTPQDVATLCSITAATVYQWHTRWRTEGIDGLADRKRSGRSKVGGEAYVQALEKTIETEPAALGYEFSVWTVDRLIDHLAKETGVRVCEKTLRNRLRDNGYVYRRPKHDLGNLQDKAAKEQADALLKELKKEPRQGKSSYSLLTKQP